APATRRRGKHSSVSGLTRKQDQRDRGRTRLMAASRVRSAGSSLVLRSGDARPRAGDEDQNREVLGGVTRGEQGEELEGGVQREMGEFRQHQMPSERGD